nr:uncharacterized protein LOC107438914 isoform X2 [Parasteatoda tepidariorum]
MTDVTSFITPSDEEPELASINFHESLRFFQEQLNLEGNHFPSSPNIHISKNGITSKFNNDLPRDETNDGTKSLSSCRISIPTVETILESVKVLRAIQKSQEQRWPMSNMLSSVGQKTQNSVPFEKTVTENDVIIVKKGGTIYSTENFVIDQECISNDSENTCFKTHGVANPLHSESGANIIESIVSKQEDDQSHCTDESKNEKCSSNFEFDSDKENGSDPTFDAEDAEESSKLKDTEGINKLYYTIEFSNNNEFSHFWPSNSIHKDVAEINSSYDKNADHSQEHNCKNPSVLEHSSTYLKHSLDFKDNTTGDSETLPNKDVITNNKIQKQCDDNLVSISEVDTGMAVYSSQNGDAPDPRGSTDHSERMMESSTVFDILADIKSSAAVADENDDTLDKVALKSTPINELVGKETQLNDGLKNGSAHEKLASHPETTLKLQLIDSSPPLSNQTSNGNIVSLTEQTKLECVRTPLSTDTSPESKCDKLTDVPNAVEQTVTVENKRPLSIEENYNQYEVFTETCKYMPNVQSTDLSDSNHSIVESNLSGGGSNKNAKRDDEETRDMKDGYLKETNPAIKNEAHIELNTNGEVQKMDANDSLEVKKKFITSSWDLVSIVKLLYAIPEPQPRKVHSCEQMLQTKVLLLSKGSFSKYPEGVYEINVDDNNLTVLQNSESILNFSLSYAEFSLDVGDILRIDNKMGRSLYMKSNSKRESLDWIETLQTLSDRQPECINLVHYPLKSYQNTLIIDLGSCSTRAGILMDQPTLPMFFFPSVCATDKTTGKNEFGMEALEPSKRQNSTISFPIRPSLQIIKHNIDVEKVTGIFKKIFKHLRVDPENYTVS